MKNKTKDKDLMCSECGYIYPFKVYRQFNKIKGFKYCYCFKCKLITKHQTIDSIDLYTKDLESKDYNDLTGKDKICKRLLKIK